MHDPTQINMHTYSSLQESYPIMPKISIPEIFMAEEVSVETEKIAPCTFCKAHAVS